MRPIKHTDETRQRLKDEFSAYVDGLTEVDDIRFTRSLAIKSDEKVYVYMTPEAFAKQRMLVHHTEDEIACLGDQLLTDILGANRMGFTSILVNSLAPFEPIPTRINRFFEKKILKRLKKKKLLVKGEYYD